MKKSFVNSCDCCLCPTCSSLSSGTILPFFHLFQYHVLAVSFLRLERCQPNYSHCCSQYTWSCITSSEYSSKEYCCDLLFPSSKTISNFPEPAPTPVIWVCHVGSRSSSSSVACGGLYVAQANIWFNFMRDPKPELLARSLLNPWPMVTLKANKYLLLF